MITGIISVARESPQRSPIPLKNGKIVACTFDYWETLVEEREKGAARMERISREFLDLPLFKGLEADEVLKAVEKRWKSVLAFLSTQPFEMPMEKFLEGLLEDLGVHGDRKVLQELTCQISKFVHDQTVVLDGAPEFLSFLKERGVKVGLISNTQFPRPLVEESMEKLGLLRFFDSIVLSSEVSWRKPYPEIFRQSLKELKANPENTIHFGDSPYYDVEGAKRAGLFPIQVLASRFRPQFEAEVGIADWNSAKSLFIRMWG